MTTEDSQSYQPSFIINDATALNYTKSDISVNYGSQMGGFQVFNADMYTRKAADVSTNSFGGDQSFDF